MSKSVIDRLRGIKDRADGEEENRRNYKSYLSSLDESTQKEYAEIVKVLFGSDEELAMSLYPDGFYNSIEEARNSAKEFWRHFVEMVSESKRSISEACNEGN